MDPSEIKQLTIDRKWYLNQVTSNQDFIKKETSQLLDCLEQKEIVDFMMSSYFEKTCLKDCLKLGLSSTNINNGESVLLTSTVEYVLQKISEIAKKVDLKSKVKIFYTQFCIYSVCDFNTLLIWNPWTDFEK